METNEKTTRTLCDRGSDWKYVMVLVLTYLLFLLATTYVITTDTRKQIQANHQCIENLIEKKQTHLVDSKEHDHYAREHLSTIIAKVDDLNVKIDDYYANVITAIERKCDERVDK